MSASRRGIAVLASVAATLLAAASLCAPPSAGAKVPASFYGVSPQLLPTAAELDRMGRGGIGTLRLQLSWAAAEPEPPEATGPTYDFSQIDPIVANAARNGIVVLPFIYSTPPWVAAGLDGWNCAFDCYFFAPRSEEALDAWARFTGDLVDRYGPGGRFWEQNPSLPQLPIRAWQIWNEQNSPTFYRPEPDVRAYAELLSRAAAAIRARDPGAEVVLGGMFGTPGRRPALTAWGFLRQLYGVPGAAASFDGVAPHPYAANIDGVKEQLARFRDETRREDDEAVDFWVTEIGWASGGEANPLNRGLKGQAKRLQQSFSYLLRQRRRMHIRNVTWYSWRDNSTDTAGFCKWCPHAGLFEEGELAPKPAWRKFVGFTGGE